MVGENVNFDVWGYMSSNVHKRITVTQVAKYAGVSRTAVYSVLSGKKTTTGVSEATRQKISHVLDQLGYIPNQTARSLVSGQSNAIGVLLSDSDTPLLRHLVYELGIIAAANGKMLTSSTSNCDPMIEKKCLEQFFSRGMDGVIIARTSPDVNNDILKKFIGHGIPVVILGALDNNISGARVVAFDEPREMELIAEFLNSRSLHRISYLGFSNNLSHFSQDRCRYLHDAVTRYADLQLINEKFIHNYDECREFAHKLVVAPVSSRPAVVVCYNDQLADLLINNLQICGMQVPQDISVIGIDGIPSEFHAKKITSVLLPPRAMAQAIYQSLWEDTGDVLIKPQFVVGKTTR